MPESPGPDEPESSPEPPTLVDVLKDLFAPVTRFHREHPIYFWLSTVATIAAALGVGAWLAPEIVVDEFLWRHFWGPTAADANQSGFATRNGIRVSEDYTLTSEIVYGLILAASLVSVYIHLFKKRGIAVDDRFVATLLPYIVFGPMWRSMEDASVFCEQGTQALGQCDPGLFSWAFISPFIYLVTAAAVITHLLLAHATRSSSRRYQLRTVGGWLGLQVLAYLAIFVVFREQFTILVSPSTVAVLALLSLGVYYWATERGGDHLHWALVTWGLPMTVSSFFLVWEWELGSPWVEATRAGAGEIIPITVGLTVLVTGGLAIVAWLGRERWSTFWAYMTPLNLGLVAGHMVDAFATFSAICANAGSAICSGAQFLGVETSGYGEKHPVSEVFLAGFQVDWGVPGLDQLLNLVGGTLEAMDGWGFPLMKLILVLAIIVLVERSAREGQEDPDLIGLVKLAVLVLGLAPGIRSALRVAMGV